MDCPESYGQISPKLFCIGDMFMSGQRYTPEFKEEACRSFRCWTLLSV